MNRTTTNLTARADAPWKRHVIDDSSIGADGVRFADANGDGRLDVVTGWEEGGVVRLCLHPGKEKVKDKWPSVAVGRVGDPEDAVMADVDGDGAMDVISSCEGKTQTVFVHWGPKDKSKILDESAWKTAPIPITVGRTRWMFCLPLQIDSKKGIDLVCGSKQPNGQVCWLESPPNPRDLSAWKLHPLRKAGWIMSLIAHNVDGDGDQDIVITDRKGARTGCFWLENPGIGEAQTRPWKEHLIGGAGREVMFAVVWSPPPQPSPIKGEGAESGSSPSPLRGGGLGWGAIITCAKERDALFLRRESSAPDDWKTFIIPWVGNVGRAKGINIADIDLDGKLDLICSCESAGGEKSGVFWMSYRKSLTNTDWDFHDISGTVGVKYDLVELRDLDGDGDLDVITTEEKKNLGVIWYENPKR